MRDELATARRMEEIRKAKLERWEAVLDLIRHQDTVRVLDSRGMVTDSDRTGLGNALDRYRRSQQTLRIFGVR